MTTSDPQNLLRQLPAVDSLLQDEYGQALQTRYGRSLTLDAIRQTLDGLRHDMRHQRLTRVPTNTDICRRAADWLNSLLAPTLRPVINATGIIVHTNLGRAPLSQAALTAVRQASEGYSTLEFDLGAGERGSRAAHAEKLLRRLTGAEAALAVNNNAAGTLLMLSALCAGKEVLISRGQLVEIGGGFRVPDVMAQSGAVLREVGTTNRTHLRDYENAITDNTAAILVAHHSNFKIVGFTTEPSLDELAALAHAHGLLLLYDQGSGAMSDLTAYGLDPEPTVLAGLEANCDVVAFSGDKLLGGPQAGLLVGQADAIARCKRHPLARAVRADKMALAALAATLTHFLLDEMETAVPVWQMMARRPEEICETAEAWRGQLAAAGTQANVIPTESRVGGGSAPGTSLPSYAVAIRHNSVNSLAKALRLADTPVIGRLADGRFLLDPRTVLSPQEATLLQTLIDTIN